MWRKIVEKDVKRGTCVRFIGGGFGDTVFNGATIIYVDDNVIYYARPYVYAHNEFNTNQPLMGCEVFSQTITSACSLSTDVQVYEGRDGEVRSMVT